MKKLLGVLLVVLCLGSIFSVISTVKADLSINPSTAPQDFEPHEARCVDAGSEVLVIEDVYTWGMEQLYNAPDAAACSDLGISYDVVTSTLFKYMPLMILQFYKAIVLMADQPQSYYQNLYDSRQKLADYVSGGGVLSAVIYTGWIGYIVTQQFLPGNVILNFEYCNDVDFNPTHFIISNPESPVSLDGPWGYNTIIDNINMASSFYFTNLPAGSSIVAEDAHGHDVLVEYHYGSGKVLAVGIPIQWFYRYKLGLGGTGCQPPWDGANNLRLLYNELLYQSGLVSIKDRLLSAMGELKARISSSIEYLAREEATMNRKTYKALEFHPVRFVASLIVDLAAGATIGTPPDEIKDVTSLQYLNALSKVMFYTKWGIKTTDAGLCLLACDDYIHAQGLTENTDIENAYYSYIMGTASQQASGEVSKIRFTQDSTTYMGLQELLDDIDADYQSFVTELQSLTISDIPSNVELAQYVRNLRNTISRISVAPSIVYHIGVTDDREQISESELGNLLNLEKQQDELIERKNQAQLVSDACTVAKAAAVGAKIVNILALGTLTGVQIAVTVVSAGVSVISAGASAIDLTAKAHIVGNQVQSFIEMGSEVVHLKQIIDEAESYVNWRVTRTPATVNGEIPDLIVPEVITDGLSGSQTGTVTIKNTGSSAVWAMAHIQILGPTAFTGSKMAVYFTAVPADGIRIEPGTQQSVTFDYSVLDLGHIQGCNQYEARAFVSLEGKMIGPTVRFFKAGCGCQSSSSNVLSGEILASGTESAYVTIGADSVEAEFDLSYLGSDLDLHLYDQQGNHVGMNYNTMQVEVNIPGASYSGAGPNPEWIELPVTAGSTLMVAVVGVSVFGSESYTVTLTQYPHYHSASLVLNSTHADVEYGEKVDFKITLQNRGNVPDAYDLTVTGLDGQWFTLSQSLFNLDPGSMATAVLTVHAQTIGVYSFSVIAKCTQDPTIFDTVDASLNVVRSAVAAIVESDPETLNLESNGRWITVYIQLPADYDPADINASTILLNGTIAPVLDHKYGFVKDPSGYLVDHNGDGILERMVKFDRTVVGSLIYNHGSRYGNVALTLTGKLTDGTSFEGTDVIFVNYAGDVNNDGTINIFDILMVKNRWQMTPNSPNWIPECDVNNDETINIFDILTVKSNWGQTVP